MTQSAQADQSEKIPVKLQGEKGDEFYAWVGDGRSTSSNATELINGEVYEHLCSAPCEAKLPVGRNRIAVASGGSPVVASRDITLYAPTTLTAHYSSYSAQRILGTLVLVAGSVGGVALIFTAPACKEDPTDLTKPLHCTYTQQIIGTAVGVASVVVGSLLLLKSDRVEVSIAAGAPTAGSLPLEQTGHGMAALDTLRAGLSGLSFSGRF
jgi:hypothetical protein